jgi:putative transcriptional regulator
MSIRTAQPRHHPEEDMRIAYGVGTLVESRRLLMATHMLYCPDCQAESEMMARTGGAMLDDLSPATLSPGSLDSCLAAIGGGEPPKSTKPLINGDLKELPDIVRHTVGKALGSASWRFAAPGVRSLDLSHAVRHASAGEILLLKIWPGFGVAKYMHAGEELTLVLTGAFRDEVGYYGPGDVSIGVPGMIHRPIAEPGDLCYVLAVTDAPLLFKGPLGVIQRVLGW